MFVEKLLEPRAFQMLTNMLRLQPILTTADDPTE